MNDDIIICPICGFKTENLCLSHIKTHGYFDAKSFKKEFNLPFLKSERLRNNQSSFMTIKNPTKGKMRTLEEIQLMSKNRYGKGLNVTGKYIRTPEIREKISEGVILAHFRGDYNLVKPGNGEFIFAKKANRTIFVRSSWEKRVVLFLDSYKEIEYYNYEPFVIHYEFEGAKHKYIPDFYVRTIWAVEEIWEIKRDDLINNQDPKTMAKIKALKEYCSTKQINARILKLNDIIRLEKANKRQR